MCCVRRSRFLTFPILCAAVAGCGGGDSGSAKPSPTKTAKRAPEATATPALAPLTFGSNRYVSPCSVLPMDAAQRIYGPMQRLGYVRQEFYDRSMTEDEFKRETAGISGSVRTLCAYTAGAMRGTGPSRSRSSSTARRRPRAPSGRRSRTWARKHSMGGKRVKGADDVLFVAGHAEFVGFHGNALIRLSYLPIHFSAPRFTPGQYRTQAAKANEAFQVINEQLDRADLAQAPLGPSIGGEQKVNGVPYLDPCSVLNEKLFELATGRAQTDNAESESLPVDAAAIREAADDLYGQSPEATCDRRAGYKRKPSDVTSRSDTAWLSVRVAAEGDHVTSGTELASD